MTASLKRYYYDVGLPFSEVLANCIEPLKQRVFKDNKVAMIIIDGGLGKGKTTLGTHIADYIQGAYTKENSIYKFNEDKQITFNTQLSTGGDDFKVKIRKIKNHPDILVLIYDEAGDFNRRGSLSQFNARLNQIFEIYRAFKIIVVLIIPSFKSVDGVLLEKEIPRLLLHISTRNNYYGDWEAYSLKKMHYILKNMKELTIPSFAYKKETPIFRGHFLDLPPKRNKELDRFSTKGKYNLLEINEIRDKGLLTYSQLAGRLNRSVVWVKKTILKNKIKFNKTYKKARYFNPETMDVLVTEIDKIEKIRKNQ